MLLGNSISKTVLSLKSKSLLLTFSGSNVFLTLQFCLLSNMFVVSTASIHTIDVIPRLDVLRLQPCIRCFGWNTIENDVKYIDCV